MDLHRNKKNAAGVRGAWDFSWLRGKDLNLRPLGYEPNELPDCSTPRQVVGEEGFEPSHPLMDDGF